jgi:hypothetical protein
MELPEQNYNLSLLELNENIYLIKYDISGMITISNNIVHITFNNLLNIPNNSYYLINNSFIYITNLTNNIIIDVSSNYYNSGVFNNIQLLDNNYFDIQYPRMVDYIDNVSLNENLLSKQITGTIPQINNYDINSLINIGYDDIIYYDTSSISILGSDELKIELM